jgi:predicted PurR-regulated permease PerM
MSDRRAGIVFLLVVLTAMVAVAYGIMYPFLRPVAFALVIGIGFYPLHIRIKTLISRRNLSALVSTLGVLLLFIVPAILLASAASRDLIRTAHFISTKSASEGGVISYVDHLLERPLNWLGAHVDLEKAGLQDMVDAAPAAVSRLLLKVATYLVTGLASFAGDAVITFFVLFFIFRDGASSMEQIVSLLPLNPERAGRLVSRIRDSVIANLYGILAVSLIQGLLIGIAMLIVRVPSPLLLGAAAAALSPVPMVGSALLWLPIAIFQMATGHWLRAIFLLAWGTIVVGTADNIIRPLVIVGRVKLHPVLLLFALIGGVKQFGFIGLFIGPVVISLLLALVDMLREQISDLKVDLNRVPDTPTVPPEAPESLSRRSGRND